MAGDWIKMRHSLRDDPAVVGMARELKSDEDTIVGKLHAVWSWADEQTTDGNAENVTGAFIDRKARCTGFADAMKNQGWLDIRKDGLGFPRFERHNGQTAKARALTAKRVQRFRTDNSNGATVTKALPEKSREEKKNTHTPTGVVGGNSANSVKNERKPASGPHHELIRTFCKAWKARWTVDFDFGAEGGKNAGHIKTLLAKVHGDQPEAERIVQAYLADSDKYLIENKHPVGLLISRFNKYRAKSKPKEPDFYREDC